MQSSLNNFRHSLSFNHSNLLLLVLFGLSLQSGVATAYHYPPNLSVFNVRLLRINFSISSFTTSTNLLFGLPLLLFPGNSISIIFLPTYSWSLLITCPYHLSLPSLVFIPNRYTLTVLLMYSFLILSFLVTPIANLNIFISATSISSTCFFVAATIIWNERLLIVN